MRKIIIVILAALALVIVNSQESHAYRGGHGGHFRVGVWLGPGLWWPNYYPYYPYYPAPPVVVQEPPETYIQQPPADQEPDYWYYCPEPKGYYPYVKKCPKGWMKVIPPSAPTEPEE